MYPITKKIKKNKGQGVEEGGVANSGSEVGRVGAGQ